MIRDKFSKIFRKKKRQESKPQKCKPKIKSMKSRQTIESKGIILINQVKEIESSLKEFDGLDFLSEQEETGRIKLVIEREKLTSQIKILSWVLEGEKNV